MKNISIKISDIEYEQLGLNKSELTLSEFLEVIDQNISTKNLEKSIHLAEKYGLSFLNMDDINAEIRASRDAKNNS